MEEKENSIEDNFAQLLSYIENPRGIFFHLTYGSRLTGVASVIKGRTGGVISELAVEQKKRTSYMLSH